MMRLERNVHVGMVLVAAAISGCMLSPGNGQTVSSTGAAISANGFITKPLTDVRIYSSASKTGPFTLLKTAKSETSSLATTPALYGFVTSVHVPNASWASACGGQETFLRAETTVGDLDASLFTFDAQGPQSQSPLACLSAQLSGGASATEAALACRSADSPIVRVVVPARTSQPTTYRGDIVINTAADAQQWVCLQTLNGNLTVSGATFDTITLPNLQSVNGDVTLHYAWSGQPPPNGPPPGEARKIVLPSLTTVGGALLLTGEGPHVSSTSFAFGMGALAAVGGNLSIDLQQAFGTGMSGLGALTSLPAGLSIVNGGGDMTTGAPFLAALTHVAGDVHLSLGHNMFVSQNFMPALATVGGSFEHVAGNLDTVVLSSLTAVGGDLLITKTGMFNVPDAAYVLPALATVGGVLTVSDNPTPEGKINLRYGASTGLVAGGLDVEGMAHLQTLDAAHLSIAPTGSITIANDPNLCQSAVDAWLTGLGWLGPATTTGNDDGC